MINLELIKLMPKIDLHRHLEGSIRFKTLTELSKDLGLGEFSERALSSKVQIQPEDDYSLENFLSKFTFLRKFYQSREIIQRITQECIEDAILDNIRYLELRFSPAAITNKNLFKYEDVINWVLESISTSTVDTDLKVRTIVSINRHEPLEMAEKIISASLPFKNHGLVGIDLSGDESNYSADPFVKIFNQVKREGLHITIHAGEWGSAENIRQALLRFQAERIGHGVRILDDPEIVRLASNSANLFEVCVSSNYLSGVVKSIKDHPIRKMMDKGLKISVNTDDPSISGIQLSDEFYILIYQLGFTLSEIHQLLINSIQGSFLEETEMQKLKSEFSILYQHWTSKIIS